jgi:hypothetical protein
VLLTFVVLQRLRARPQESVGAVKERWRMQLIADGEQEPVPLRACPRDLRATA